MKLTFDFEGAELHVDLAHISFRQAQAIQEFTGLSIHDWQDSLDYKIRELPDGRKEIVNPPPEWITNVAAVYWLALRQSGDAETEITEVDPDILAFYAAFLFANIAETQRLLEEAKKKPAAPKSPQPRGPKARATASRTSATPTTTTPAPLVQGEVLSGSTGS